MKTREPSWTYIAPDDVVGVIHYISGKAKVTYFHHFPMGHQYVPGSEVSMNALRRKGRINAPHLVSEVDNSLLSELAPPSPAKLDTPWLLVARRQGQSRHKCALQLLPAQGAA